MILTNINSNPGQPWEYYFKDILLTMGRGAAVRAVAAMQEKGEIILKSDEQGVMRAYPTSRTAADQPTAPIL